MKKKLFIMEEEDNKKIVKIKINQLNKNKKMLNRLKT